MTVGDTLVCIQEGVVEIKRKRFSNFKRVIKGRKFIITEIEKTCWAYGTIGKSKETFKIPKNYINKRINDNNIFWAYWVDVPKDDEE
jgi:hypothetical protein